jgi:hypothetical protein
MALMDAVQFSLLLHAGGLYVWCRMTKGTGSDVMKLRCLAGAAAHCARVTMWGHETSRLTAAAAVTGTLTDWGWARGLLPFRLRAGSCNIQTANPRHSVTHANTSTALTNPRQSATHANTSTAPTNPRQSVTHAAARCRSPHTSPRPHSALPCCQPLTA